MDKRLSEILLQKEILTYLDIHFATLMQQLHGQDDIALFLAAASVSSSNRQGHVCLDISLLAGKPVSPEKDLAYPDLLVWIETLNNSPVVGVPGDFKPLVFDGRSKLYLHRYSAYQTKLAMFVKSRVSAGETYNPALLKKHLNRLFGSNQKTQEVDWQQIASIVSAFTRFSVISGGPGTGKTTTIVKLMALLLEMNPEKALKIALAVPTGKAAARLQDAIRDAREHLPCTDEIKALIPSTASTLHRLLGTIPGSPYFRHHEENLLDVDVAIIDESSMVDLALLAKLVAALPVHARLILVGDKDQLASVEAGSVFGDICDACQINGFSDQMLEIIQSATGMKIESPETEGEGRIQNCMVQLVKSYRFGDDSGIQAVSSSVNASKGRLAVKHMNDPKYQDITWKNLSTPRDLKIRLTDPVIQGFRAYLSSKNPETCLQLFGKFRILCALREGPFGVNSVNRLVEEILIANKLIRTTDDPWYPGRPVMVTQNDYNLKLFNGDIGITLYAPEDKEYRVFFQDEKIGFRKIHPSRLGAHETVYAMTVHKSQGSEFERLLLLLPDRESPVLTQELIYTAVTRAQKQVSIWGNETVFRNAVSRRVTRVSGLRDELCLGQ